ncbi:MAG: V-type ATP synthase subunit I [Clostridiales bacterium]|nr:V-type ATP synthase subunit I [Clostridiales bacterium]
MSIAKMKRVHLIALRRDRDALMAKLLHVGCLEVNEPTAIALDSAWTEFLHRDNTDISRRKQELGELNAAMDALQKYAPQKSKLLSPRPTIREADFFNEAALDKTMGTARQINEHTREIARLTAREIQVKSDMLALQPWLPLDVSLDCTGTRQVSLLLGTLPTAADIPAVQAALAQAAPEAELFSVSENKEQKYAAVLVFKTEADDAVEALRSSGFAYTQLKEMHGTARENMDRLTGELSEIGQQREKEIAAIASFGKEQAEGQLCIDRLNQEIAQEDAKERLMVDDTILYLDGWVPEADAKALTDLLADFDCAWDLTDPTPEEYPQVPVKLNNNFLTRSLNVVTDMYSPPAYDGVDPNPLMAPFFIFFFGLMMADMGYGILMIVASLIVLKKKRPAVGTRNFMELVFWCGIATFIFGALTGGFLGDFIPQICRIINPASTFNLPSLFTPLDDTVSILLGSLVLGLIQVVTGMAISVVQKVKNGDWADALWDEVTWWIILAGVALMVLKIGMVGGVPVVLCVGGVMLLYGSTRKAKGFGKAAALIGAIYNGVTGFFSDILSYLRLMALMLAGSVIAQVFNTLGSVFGSVIPFIIISLVGNGLNMALNLLGCYVHDLRLQCLEYFGRFYKEGTRSYRPLSIQTKYTEIIKEEK